MTNLIDGTAGNDLLTGTTANDLILGYAGNDRLVGLAGDDTLDGGAGTNQIDAGDGNDTVVIDGTAVNGSVYVPATGIDGGAGTDTIRFAGVSTDYHVVQVAGGWLTVTDLTNGSKTIAANVEHLLFADTEVWLVPHNTAPIVSGDVTGAIAEGAGLLTLDALANASDADAGDVLGVTLAGALPAGVSLDAASQSFVVDANDAAFDALTAGEEVVLHIAYGVTDGTATTAALAVVTVTGSNDAAQIAGQLGGAVAEDGTAQVAGQAAVSDVDHGQASFAAATVAGTYGTLTLDAAGAWGYALNTDALAVQALAAGQVVQDLLTIHSLDGTAAQITIAVTGAADAGLIVGTKAADKLVGTRAAEHIYGQGGADRLTGAAGDDTLAGGSGADRFVFAGRFGDDVVTDFDPNQPREVLDLANVSGASSYADLCANHMTEIDGSAVLSFGTNSITLDGVSMASLLASDFLF